jgi:Succinate dehydrogenase/fumarate reductase, flavoprotein subunit
MSPGTTHVETDVLIIGSGGAGMYAAIEARAPAAACCSPTAA